MSLSFPTRTGPKQGASTGYPDYPEPRHMCHCRAPEALDETGLCEWCGRFPAETIAETWDRRARQLAGRRARRQQRAKVAA